MFRRSLKKSERLRFPQSLRYAHIYQATCPDCVPFALILKSYVLTMYMVAAILHVRYHYLNLFVPIRDYFREAVLMKYFHSAFFLAKTWRHFTFVLNKLYNLCSIKLKLTPNIFKNGWDDDSSLTEQAVLNKFISLFRLELYLPGFVAVGYINIIFHT